MRFSYPFALALVLAAAFTPTLTAHAALPPLVPRAVLFGDAEQDAAEISPDGRWLAWAKRGPDGVVNLWVRGLDRDTTWQVTRDPERGTHHGWWTPDSKRLLFLDDRGGDENEHVFAVEVATGATRELTPYAGVRCEGVSADARDPDNILVGMNRRDPKVFDLWRVNLATGDAVLEAQNPGDVTDWTTDRSFRVRGCTALRPTDSATILRVRDTPDSPWRDLVTWPMESAGFDRARKLLAFLDDSTVLVQSWAGSNTARLVAMSTRDGRVLKVLANDPRCDLWNEYDGAHLTPQVLLSADGSRVLAAAFDHLKPEWHVLDPSVKPDLDALTALANGATVVVRGRDDADRRWVVGLFGDRSLGRFVLWDRKAKRATPLFDCSPELEKRTLASMEPVVVRARDGLELPCYLTLPPGVPAKGLPIVLDVHGGPWFRDEWTWNPEVQLLANRGYAVLQVQFRGSTGFGTTFLNAGDHEFGPGKVHTDLLDALDWAVKKGIADPKRAGIMGWSFGGYATLCGLAFAPGRFACGVDGVGPSDLGGLIQSFPPYWSARRQRWLNRMGDVVADSALNRRLSPYYHVDAIRAPVLVGHGVNDPRAKFTLAETMVKELRAQGREVTFVVYPDEGHGFGRTENNQDFYGRVEEFLAKNLGGRAEAWKAVAGSSAEVR